ncbi:hypothetical protein CTheo_3270 [Ceratobasidium theobromae]|uniref:F-box domain-containing protein n=1 Tax=Ceratobasidium theobromae TaxID=1582974 RepID=A0A5N5QPW4_9AGAM|nr:hypothetical protein CTheo_3270 [Ceratobasidium theobromae]
MQTPLQNKSPALRVFGIPELASMICTQIQKGDTLNLSRVCHQLFYNTIPFIWRSTDAIVTLITMILGVGVIPYSRDSEALLPVRDTRPPNILKSNLARFNLYAPHVKRLKIPMLLIDEFNNWNGSLACAQSVNLLPNLEEIEWKYVPGTLAERTGLDIINWIAAFLPESTSLQKLHISSNYKLPKRERCYVDLEQICRLLQDAPQQWNCLDTLTFLPGGVPPQRRFTEPVDKYENLPLELSVGISSFIRSLGNLRTLSISTLAFEPRVITAIAQLPLLESLTIKCIYETGQVYYENWELPEPAFASLKALQLHNICWSTVIRICDINPLVQNLRNIRPTALLSHETQCASFSLVCAFNALAIRRPAMPSKRCAFVAFTTHELIPGNFRI